MLWEPSSNVFDAIWHRPTALHLFPFSARPAELVVSRSFWEYRGLNRRR